ncbi:MAG: ABC transporter permease [Williamsia sp.]|nr:ABC transporter permease [Williamsia sp.]
MLRNFFIVAVRNLARNKLLSFVNIAGLAIGLACVMLIMMFINDEWSFDKMHTKGDRITRLVQTTVDTSGEAWRQGNTGLLQGPVMKQEVPEVEDYCRVNGWDMMVKKGSEGISNHILFADPSIFSMFSVGILNGNANRLLHDKAGVVISETAAKKFFGSNNAIGKMLDIDIGDGFQPFIVQGVVKDPPLNSSLRFDMLLSMQLQYPTNPEELNRQLTNWFNASLNTFFLLHKDADLLHTQKKFDAVYMAHNREIGEARKKGEGIASHSYTLQPFYTMHLDGEFYATNGLSSWSDASYSYILSGLSVLLLIIACINFINISVARSMQRSKEIGIRKVAGSSRKQIIKQFLGESFIVTLLSFVAAVFLIQFALPFFNQLSNKHFSVAYLAQPSVILLFAGLIILVSFLAGSYPAFVASGFQPVQTLYSKSKLSGKNVAGKTMVVVQFIIAAALIICSFVFNKQFHYISHADLGYDASNMLYLQFPWGKPDDLQRFKNELLQNSFIESVGTKSGNFNKTTLQVNGKPTDWVFYEHMDDKYLQTLHIPLVQGRYLSYSNPADTVNNCVVNEAFVQTYLDKSKPAIGQEVGQGGNKAYTVVGVVKNYHSDNFKKTIEPIYFTLDTRGDLLNTYIKYTPGKQAEAMQAVQKIYKTILPYNIMELSDMQQWLLQRYQKDLQWKGIVSFAAIVAISISICGLFALTVLSVQQRVKEIGIRKVLGASVSNICFMLSKEFLWLILIGFVIAAPVSAYVMGKWLNDFAYRIELSGWIFVTAGLFVMLVTILTMSIYVTKAAIANPVKSLRTE